MLVLLYPAPARSATSRVRVKRPSYPLPASTSTSAAPSAIH